jgi:cysteine-rich repeat protein
VQGGTGALGLAGIVALTVACGEGARQAPPTETTAASSVGTATDTDDAVTTGATDAEASSSGATEAVCGNAVVEGEEPCDDGNDEPLDGCLSQCRLGPDGIELTPGRSLQYQGAGGGVRYDDICSETEVVIGLRGQATDERVVRLQVVCGTLVITETEGTLTLSISEPRTLDERGSESGTEFDATCPPGSAVAGFSGRAEAKLFALALHCAPLSIIDDDGGFRFAVDLDDLADLPAVGGEAGQAFGPTMCDPGEAVTAAVIRAAGDINGLGLECSSLGFSGP